MRVTHVITRLVVGGAQENTVATVLGLSREPGFDVHLLSGPTTGPEGSLVPLFASRPQLLTEVPDLLRPIHPARDLAALRQLTEIFRSSKPDVVHTHSGKAGVLGRLAAVRAGVPIIVHTIHGPSFGNFQGLWANLAFKAAERKAGRGTTHFVSVANAMTRQYLAAGIGTPEQYTRIFSGFDLQPFLGARNDPAARQRWGLKSDDLAIGMISRLFKLKGHDDLIDSAPQIIAAVPNARFLLVGDGAWRARLEQRVRDTGLSQYFVFTGLIAPSEVPSLMGIMDMLVHLSRREGLARALPQAMAAGIPVVAYDCDGASEVCLSDQTGFLVAPGDTAELTRRIAQLANDPALRQRLGLAGCEMVRSLFSEETMVRNISNLYRQLAAARPK